MNTRWQTRQTRSSNDSTRRKIGANFFTLSNKKDISMQDFRQKLTRERRPSGRWDQFDCIKAGDYYLSIQAGEYAHCTPQVDLDNPYNYATFEVVIKRGENLGWIHPSSIEGLMNWTKLGTALFCHEDNIGYRVPVADIQKLYEFLCNPKPAKDGRGTTHQRIRKATELGLESFWGVVAARFPEIKTGDLDPIMVVHSEAAMREAVQQWVQLNADSKEETQENG